MFASNTQSAHIDLAVDDLRAIRRASDTFYLSSLGGRIMTMALNLKDEETVALVTEVARRRGLTKTAAVRAMAQRDLDELDRDANIRHAEFMHFLETEIWPHTAGKKISKEEIEELLGYDEMLEG
jgi:hypothetical protein